MFPSKSVLRRWIPSVGLAFSMALTGCNTQETASNLLGATLADGTSMTASIGGKKWNSDLGAHFMKLGTGVSITGMDGFDRVVVLSLNQTALGEYKVDERNFFSISYSDGDEYYFAKEGTITITKNSGTWIEGTFAAEMRHENNSQGSPITISHGKFVAKPADSTGK